jgi:predicted lipoprotein with Yx(FWY)xxD motif
VNDIGGPYVVEVCTSWRKAEWSFEMKIRWLAVAGLTVAGVMLAACGSSAASSPASGSSPSKAAVASGPGVKTMNISGRGTVLTDTAGHTLYWYAIDTPTASKCNGVCATFWPPVSASLKVAHGVSLPGKWGSVTRADGTKQLTYDGHPLYTFKLDTKPGQVKGNGLTTSGGASADLWWAVTPTNVKLAAAPSGGSSSGSGGGGYGY